MSILYTYIADKKFNPTAKAQIYELFNMDPDASYSEDNTYIYQSVVRYDFQYLLEEILKSKLDIDINAPMLKDIYEEEETTPLMFALENGYNAVATVLLNNGASIDVVEGDENTPLSLAFEKCSEKIVSLLLSKFPSAQVRDTDPSPLLWACKKGYTSVIPIFITNSDIDVVDENGNTGLFLAVTEDSTDIALLLIDAKADINRVYIDESSENSSYMTKAKKQTVLQVATSNKNLDIVKTLVGNVEIDTVNELGYSALHIAADNGSLDIVKLLIDSNADVNLNSETDGTGETPYSLASKSQHDDIITALTQAGAVEHVRKFD